MIVNSEFAFLLVAHCVRNTIAQVFRSGELSGECSWSLHIHAHGESEVHTFTESVESVGNGILTERIRLEGCGCYILYQGTHRTGKAFFLSEPKEESIPLARIRSVYRQDCREQAARNASVVFGVITVVLFIVGIAGGLAVYSVRRKGRIYGEVKTIEIL